MPTILDVTMYQQEDVDWCWAAAIQMVSNYLKPGSQPKQCAIASTGDHNAGADCCVQANHGTVECGVSDVDNPLTTAQISHVAWLPPLSFPKLAGEIHGNRPMIVEVVQDGGNHALVVAGVDDASQSLYALDPANGSASWMPFSYFYVYAYRVYAELEWTLNHVKPVYLPVPVAPVIPAAAMNAANASIPLALQLAKQASGAAATLGEPIAVVDVPIGNIVRGTMTSLGAPLDRSGANARVARVLWPVVVAGATVSVVEVEVGDGGDWTTSRIGDVGAFAKLDGARIAHGGAVGSYVALSVPALGITLLATMAAGPTQLIATSSVPRSKLTAGQAYSVDDALQELRTLATPT